MILSKKITSFFIILLSVSILFTAQNVVLAKENINEKKYNIGLLPDSPFYFLKIGFEKIGDLFTFNSEDQVYRDLEIAQKRLKETEVMLKKDDIEKAGKTIDNYTQRLNGIQTYLASLDNKMEFNSHMSWFNNIFKQQKEHLDKLLEEYPEYKENFLGHAEESLISLQDNWFNYKDTLLNRVNNVFHNIKDIKVIEADVEDELLKLLDE